MTYGAAASASVSPESSRSRLANEPVGATAISADVGGDDDRAGTGTGAEAAAAAGLSSCAMTCVAAHSAGVWNGARSVRSVTYIMTPGAKSTTMSFATAA